MKTVTALQTTDNAIEQFYQKLLKSPEAQAQLKTANDPESLCQMAVKLGADMGYEFTIEQARAAMAIDSTNSHLNRGIIDPSEYNCS